MPRSGSDATRLLVPIAAVLQLVAVASAQAAPVACFDVSPAASAEVGQPVVFDAGCSSDTDPARTLTSLEWDFEGDGIFEASGMVVEHVYLAPGTFQPHLRVENDATPAQVDLASADLEVVGLDACLIVTPNPTPVGGTVTFDATCSTGSITSAVVDPDDGQPAFPLAELVATYVYDRPGVFTPMVTVYNARNQADSEAVAVEVSPDPPVACFAIRPNPVAVGAPVELDASCSSGSPPLELTWDLDVDGEYDDAVGERLEQVFPTTGSFDVALRVRQLSHGLADSLRAIVEVVDTECETDAECPGDGHPCIVGRCDAGLCGLAAAEPGAPCDDGDPCTMDETCDAAAICGDGLLTDADEDGYGRAGCEGGTDCDDTDPAVNPGAVELPGDGIDNDCDPTSPGCGAERLPR